MMVAVIGLTMWMAFFGDDVQRAVAQELGRNGLIGLAGFGVVVTVEPPPLKLNELLKIVLTPNRALFFWPRLCRDQLSTVCGCVLSVIHLSAYGLLRGSPKLLSSIINSTVRERTTYPP